MKMLLSIHLNLLLINMRTRQGNMHDIFACDNYN